MAPEPTGICANCETRRGFVGDPCPGDVCERKGYRYIPIAWYESAKAYATKKQKALDPLLGRCIDRYLLAGKLGEGGMGAVYLALQRPLNREVALKVISGLELTQSTIGRFEREARAIALLDHANIRKLHDYGIGELEFKVPYMALEYVRHGRTLRHALVEVKKESGGQIPGQVVHSIFRQILHALAAAHAKGIIHRDMKPDNVMIAPEHGNPYMVKVLDFGLAKAISDVSGFDSDVSLTGHVLGTPHYMAPEQAARKGRPEADGRADLYAVAVMIFEVFTGVRPFDGESPLEVMAKKVDPEFDPLALPAAKALTRPLRVFLAKGLAPEPDARYQDADAMLDAFENTLSGRVTSAVGLVRSSPTNPSDERPATPPSPAHHAIPMSTARMGEGPEVQGDGLLQEEVLSSTVSPQQPQSRVMRWWPWALAALAVPAGLLVFRALTPGSTAVNAVDPPAVVRSPAVGDVQAAAMPAQPADLDGGNTPDPSPDAVTPESDGVDVASPAVAKVGGTDAEPAVVHPGSSPGQAPVLKPGRKRDAGTGSGTRGKGGRTKKSTPRGYDDILKSMDKE